MLALRRAGKAQPLSSLIQTIGSEEGRRRVIEHLENLPFPHYEPAEGKPGMLVRIEADGKRVVGRFVDRRFVASE